MSRNRERQQELQPGRISTNGGIVNLEYMIKRETPDAMK